MTITRQKPQWEVRIAGRVVPKVLEVQTSAGFDQINAEATISVAERPSWADEGDSVTIWGKNGANAGQIFAGELVTLDWTYAPTKIGLVCQGILARTRLEWGGDEYEYTEQDDAAIIRNLLEKMGIPSSAASIESSSWTLGTIDPITLKEGDVPYNIIQEIDDLAGYRTYELTTGVIVRRRVSGVAGANAAITYSQGVTVLPSPKRNRSRLGIVNRAIVTGVEYEGLTIGGPGVAEASAANIYIPSPPGFITENVQSALVEDDAKALEIAKRIVADKNRRPEVVEFEVPFDPRVQPGMTLGVAADGLELDSSTVFCQYVSHNLGNPAKTTIRALGGALTPAAAWPPVAAFTFQAFLEGEDTGAGVTPLYVCVCDGGQSYDPDGTIATYAWAAAGDTGSVTPSSGSGPVFRFVADGASVVTVALTVTDNDGLTNVLERALPLTTASALVEDLYLAYGDVACSSDGEQSWRTATPASGDATCLAPFAPSWGEVWGTSTGHIYATWDKLVTALVDLGAPHGAVACTAVWVHETEETRAWAGFSDGRVYFGELDLDAHTATWTHRGTIAEGPIVEIRESYGALNELRATAGTSYYYSTNGGATWTLVHTFDVARRMAAGFDENMATGLNTTPPIFGEVTTPTVPGGVTHLRAITFGWRQQALYAADDAAGLYTTDDTFAAFTAHADTTAAQANHMIRSGNVDGVIYLAEGDGTGSNGFQKWIPDVAAPFWIRQTGTDAGLMIGYGGAHLLPVNVDLLLVRADVTVANQVYYYSHVTATWTDRTGDLPGGKVWNGISGSPLDPANAWAVWNDTEVYVTLNGGTNWAAVTGIGARAAIYSQGGAAHDHYHYAAVEWSATTAQEWVCVGYLNNTFSIEFFGIVAVGSGTNMIDETAWVSYSFPGNTLGPGGPGVPVSAAWFDDGRFVVATDITPNAVNTLEGSGWVTFVATAVTEGYVGAAGNPSNIGPTRMVDALATTHQIAGVATEEVLDGSMTALVDVGDVKTAPDIATPAYTLAHVAGHARNTAALTNDGIYVGGNDGITKFPYLGSSLTAAEAGKTILFIRAEHTRQTGLAAIVSTGGGYHLAVSDGEVWTEVAAPSVGSNAFGSPTVAGKLAQWVEVLAT